MKLKLNLGCGTKKLFEYINVDIDPDIEPDIIWDLEEFPYPWENNLVDEILIENTIEHISYRKHDRIYKELYRILKPGGILTVVVPDVVALYEEYVSDCTNGEFHVMFEHFLFGGHEDEYDYHKAGYTNELLWMRLSKAGFSIISIEPGMKAIAMKATAVKPI